MTELSPVGETVAAEGIILIRKEKAEERALHESRNSRTEYEDPEEIPVSEDGLAVSEDEYWEKYYEHPDFSYEWNNGYLEERPVSDYEGYLMYEWLDTTLKHFLTVYPIAKKVGLEFGFRLTLPHKTAVRKPDLAVVLNSNPAGLHLRDRSYSGIFDLCIEALSDSTVRVKQRDTVDKKGEYEFAGVREYYILDPKGKETVFYTRDAQGAYAHIMPAGDIIMSGVLPGFQFRISDLYSRPLPEQMSEDAVYQAFVLPSYQAEKQKSGLLEKELYQEKIRAEQEKIRAEQEKIRADSAEEELRRLKEKLRAGIPTD